MPLAIQSLTDLAQTDYDAALTLLRTLLAEAYPDGKWTGGANDKLLVRPAAVLEAANQQNIDRVRLASSLLALEADTTLTDDADEEVVDRLASNYRLTRLDAEQSTGTVTIVLSALVEAVVPQTAVFTDPAGLTYSPTDSFVGKTDEDAVLATTDRLIEAVGDGTFSFTVDVEAVDMGVTGNLVRGTVLTTEETIASFDHAYAAADFTGGRDTETNTALIARIRSSWTSRTPATRGGLEGLLRAQEGYEDLIAVSTIGFGDAEQQRNHSILPIAIPGVVDTFVRTQGPWESKQLTKTATLAATAMSGTRGVWQITLTRDNGPIYKVDKVTLPEDAETGPGYTISLQTRGYDVSEGDTPGTTFLPDVQAATEAALSRYQTLTLRFTDTDTPNDSWTVGVTTKDYVVAFRSLPGIAGLQDVVSDRATRSLVGDCLVRAPVPCFVTATISIDHDTGSEEVDEDAVQAAVAAAVNATGFNGSLPAPTLIAAAQSVLTAGSRVRAISMAGTIYRPAGTTAALSSATLLSVPDDPGNVVTSRTVCFFTSATDITIDVDDVDAPEA